MTCDTNVDAEEVKEMVDDAVDNVIEDFEKMEKLISTTGSGFGYEASFLLLIITCFIRYFPQFTPMSKKLSRDARLLKVVMEQVDNTTTTGDDGRGGKNIFLSGNRIQG